jgi:hypothetical protein
MRRWTAGLLVSGFMVGMGAGTGWASHWEFDLETGLVNSGYNVVRISGEDGTQISLSDDFQIQSSPFLRFKVYYAFNEEHAVGALYAPLSLWAEGQAPYPIVFADQTFPENTPLKALFRFDNYRLTYRYRFWKTETLQAHVGFTALVRDAEISVEGGGLKAEKLNLGVVPLLYLRLGWNFAGPWSFVFDADGLAAPQGRAEDVLLAITYRADEHWTLKTGYRMVEGGADNKEVYNFALVHYAVLGVVATY